MSFAEKSGALVSLYERGLVFVSQFNIHRNIKEGFSSNFDIEITLANQIGDTAKLIAVNCVDIRVGRLEGLLSAFIELSDLSDDQIKGIRMRVAEVESDLFSFMCRDLAVIEGGAFR